MATRSRPSEFQPRTCTHRRRPVVELCRLDINASHQLNLPRAPRAQLHPNVEQLGRESVRLPPEDSLDAGVGAHGTNLLGHEELHGFEREILALDSLGAQEVLVAEM